MATAQYDFVCSEIAMVTMLISAGVPWPRGSSKVTWNTRPELRLWTDQVFRNSMTASTLAWAESFELPYTKHMLRAFYFTGIMDIFFKLEHTYIYVQRGCNM